MKVTHDDQVFLAASMMNNAKITFTKERICDHFRVAQRSCVSALHPDTGSCMLHEKRVTASNSTSQMSLMECSYTGNLLNRRVSKSFHEGGHNCEEN